MHVTEANKGNYVPKQGSFIITIELKFSQVIYNARWCFKINNVRKTCEGYDFHRSHEIYAEIKNTHQRLNLSSGPPSSGRNVDSAGLANIEGISPTAIPTIPQTIWSRIPSSEWYCNALIVVARTGK